MAYKDLRTSQIGPAVAKAGAYHAFEIVTDVILTNDAYNSANPTGGNNLRLLSDIIRNIGGQMVITNVSKDSDDYKFFFAFDKAATIDVEKIKAAIDGVTVPFHEGSSGTSFDVTGSKTTVEEVANIM